MPSKARDYESDGSSSSDSENEVAACDSGIDTKPLSLFDDESAPYLTLPPAPNDLNDYDSVLGENDPDVDSLSVLGLPLEKSKLANSADSETGKPKRKKKKRKILYICTVNCKYEVVRRVSKMFGFREVAEDEDWNLYWTDYSVTMDRVNEMKRYQKINHFPGMNEICRKDLLARNLNRMAKQFPKEYGGIFPKSWVLPADYADLASYARQKKNKTYILKPASGCQGKGIWITKNFKDIRQHEHIVCQQYMSRPFLIDGYKFDFRLYVLVASCEPLRIFCFKDGLARFATAKYHDPTNANSDNVFMHLTNYAINKTSEDFIRDDEEGGSKRRISTINRWWTANGYDVDKIWRDIDDVVIKTLISINDILTHNYRSCFPNHVRGSACFEVLGFDVMFDRKLKPYVVEVNHSCSFHTDATLDKEIKEALIYDTINLLNCGAVDKRKCIEEEKKRVKDRLFNRKANKKESKEELEQQQTDYLKTLSKYEDANLGNFRRIYPAEGTERYDQFFQSSGSLFQETAAYKARSEAARQQREEIKQKQEKMDQILNRKKRDSMAPRPESPGGSQRRVSRLHHRRAYPTRRTATTLNEEMYQRSARASLISSATSLTTNLETLRPLDINEDEELERISALLQRDNLVRGLGIVEHVYRMLHCTPGTQSSSRPQSEKTHVHHSNPQHLANEPTTSTSSLLAFLSQPVTKPIDVHNTFISTQLQSAQQAYTLAQNATNPWTRKKVKRHANENRRGRVPDLNSEVSAPPFRNNQLSGNGSRKPLQLSAPALESASALTAQSIQPAYSNRMHYSSSSTNLSVISAPAPVIARPDIPSTRKSLENAIRSRNNPRRTIRLTNLDPRGLVYS